MRKIIRNVGMLAALLSTLVWIGCAGSPHRQSTGEYIDNSAITAKIKAALIDDPEIKGFDINVDSFRGTVQLSGAVESARAKQKAEEIAWGVEGVQAVKNNLAVSVREPLAPDPDDEAALRR